MFSYVKIAGKFVGDIWDKNDLRYYWHKFHHAVRMSYAPGHLSISKFSIYGHFNNLQEYNYLLQLKGNNNYKTQHLSGYGA